MYKAHIISQSTIRNQKSEIFFTPVFVIRQP